MSKKRATDVQIQLTLSDEDKALLDQAERELPVDSGWFADLIEIARDYAMHPRTSIACVGIIRSALRGQVGTGHDR